MPNRHTMNFQLGANIVEKEIIVDINPYQTRVVAQAKFISNAEGASVLSAIFIKAGYRTFYRECRLLLSILVWNATLSFMRVTSKSTAPISRFMGSRANSSPLH